jgi:hypothetical protein
MTDAASGRLVDSDGLCPGPSLLDTPEHARYFVRQANKVAYLQVAL